MSPPKTSARAATGGSESFGPKRAEQPAGHAEEPCSGKVGLEGLATEYGTGDDRRGTDESQGGRARDAQPRLRLRRSDWCGGLGQCRRGGGRARCGELHRGFLICNPAVVHRGRQNLHETAVILSQLELILCVRNDRSQDSQARPSLHGETLAVTHVKSGCHGNGRCQVRAQVLGGERSLGWPTALHRRVECREGPGPAPRRLHRRPDRGHVRLRLVTRFRPDAIVHFAEQRSAPYSMADRGHGVDTRRWMRRSTASTIARPTGREAVASTSKRTA